MPESTFDSVDPSNLPDEVIRCPDCGYDLHGIADRRHGYCPECGLPFSTRRMRERLLKRRERRVSMLRLLGIFIGLLIAILLSLCRQGYLPSFP